MATTSLQTKLLRLQLATILLFAAGALIFCWRMIIVDQAIEAHFETGRQITALRHAGDLLDAVAAGRKAEAESLRARMRGVFGAVAVPNGRASALIHAADKALGDSVPRSGVLAIRVEASQVAMDLQAEFDAAEAAYRDQLLWAAFAWSLILALPLALAFLPLRLSAGVIAGIGQLGQKIEQGRQQGASTAVIIDRQDEIGTLGHAIDETFTALRRREAEAAMARQLCREQERLADVVNLTGGIAHEIANPLAVMLANLDLVEDVGPQVVNIREGLERIQALLRDVTAFASGDEHLDAIDVNAVVGSVYRIVRLDDRLRNVQFVADLGQDVPAVNFPRAVLALSLFSLMSQAAAIIRDAKGTMIVRSTHEGGDVWVSIRSSRAEIGEEAFAGTLPSGDEHSTFSLNARVLKSAGGELMLLSMNGNTAECSIKIPLLGFSTGAA